MNEDDIIQLIRGSNTEITEITNIRRQNIMPSKAIQSNSKKEMLSLSKLRSLHRKFRSQKAKYMRACRNKVDPIQLIDLSEEHEIDFSEPPSDIYEKIYSVREAFSTEERLEWLYNYLISPSAFRNCKFRLSRKPCDGTVRCWKKRLLDSGLFPKSSDCKILAKSAQLFQNGKCIIKIYSRIELTGF